LRDDIRELLDGIASELSHKTDLLKKMISMELRLKAVLETDCDTEPGIILEQQGEFIEQINIHDYNTARLRESFLKKTGISFDSGLGKDYPLCRDILQNIKSLKNEEQKLLKELRQLRERNVERMTMIKNETQIDAEEIKRMMDIEMNYPTDPRS